MSDARPVTEAPVSEARALASGRIVDALVPAARAGLSARQVAIMAFLAGNPQCSVREIAAKLEIAKPAVTRNLNALIEMGLVTRQGSDRDHRLKQIALSEDGASATAPILNLAI